MNGISLRIRVKVTEGRVVEVKGQNISGVENRLCAKGHAIIGQFYKPNRTRYTIQRRGKRVSIHKGYEYP